MARVLIIDDASGSARMLEEALASSGLELRAIQWSETSAVDAVEFEPTLVILCLAGGLGYAAPRCAALRAEPSLDGVPLLVTGTAPEEDELARCLELGADDALILPVHPRIAAARVLALARAKADRESQAELVRAAEQGQQAFRTTVDALRRSTEAMEHTERRKRYLETHDALTGLANRAYLREFTRRTMGYARRYGSKLAVLTINLDYFDRVNENLGHATGDLLLQSVATRLRNCVRGSDIVARFGGDDFAVVLTSLSSREDAALVARKVIEFITRPHEVAGSGDIYVTPSVGVSIFPDDGETPDGLLRSADVALHRVKEQGRGQYQFYSSEMRGGSFERMQLEVMLRDALEREEFQLYYQPQVDVGKRELVGCEALIRWVHPERGMIPPADFIPLAESNGLIEPIGEWVLRTACAQKRAWELAGLGNFPISVNVSRRQFRTPGLSERIGDILRESGLEARHLEIEITENALIEDVQQTLVVLRSVRDLGVGVAIDDFGTGYSSLAVLGQFPASALKIDQAFVHDISTDAAHAAITRAVLAVAAELKLTVMAEGVETREERDFLVGLGCKRMQGYLFGRPLPKDEFEAIWRDGGDLPE
ncbi:MAG TPA: EAL domain-containing protein [Myxococcota bacterium]|nr:EAL domain-containing protein [Myxococcota bacterium]